MTSALTLTPAPPGLPPGQRPVDPDAALLARLRVGDRHAYRELVENYSGSMLRLARRYARSHAVAEEAVQETWLAVVQGLDRFEGRASFRTWVLRILVNQVQARAAREARILPMTDLVGHVGEDRGAEEQLLSSSRDRWPGHWSAPLDGWAPAPDEAALATELMARLQDAIAGLPHRQREVVTLRDVEGNSAEEVCRRLGLQPTNQRVLLHRGRAAVRAGVGPYLAEQS